VPIAAPSKLKRPTQSAFADPFNPSIQVKRAKWERPEDFVDRLVAVRSAIIKLKTGDKGREIVEGIEAAAKRQNPDYLDDEKGDWEDGYHSVPDFVKIVAPEPGTTAEDGFTAQPAAESTTGASRCSRMSDRGCRRVSEVSCSVRSRSAPSTTAGPRRMSGRTRQHSLSSSGRSSPE
jgi:hypothetical protein